MSATRTIATSLARLSAATTQRACAARPVAVKSLLSTTARQTARPSAWTLATMRTFTTTRVQRHGHVHTPKAGEE